MASHAALKEYFATLPQAKVPDVAPQFVSNAGAGLLEEMPAKVGIYRPPKVVRGLDVATVNDFPKHPGALLSLPGLPTDDMTAAIKQLSRRVEDLNAKAAMWRRPPMVLRADFRPEVSLGDVVAAFQQSRQQEKDVLFRSLLERSGAAAIMTPDEIRRLEAEQRIQRAMGFIPGLKPMGPGVDVIPGRAGRPALLRGAAGGVERALAAPGAVRRPRGRRAAAAVAPAEVAAPVGGAAAQERVVGPMDAFMRGAAARRGEESEGSVSVVARRSGSSTE